MNRGRKMRYAPAVLLALSSMALCGQAHASQRAFIKKRYVKVRKGPGKSYKATRWRLPYSSRVDVERLSGDWSRVRFVKLGKRGAGWVPTAVLRKTRPRGRKVRYVERKKKMVVRIGPSNTFRPKRGPSVRFRQRVVVLARIKRWALVRYGKKNRKGWVRRRFLSTKRPKLPPPPSSGDPNVALQLYDEARKAKASGKVLLALFEAALVESRMRNLSYGDRDSIGVLQIRVGFHGYETASNVRRSARWFLPQAIRYQYKYSTPGRLAQAVQRSAFPARYDQTEGLARAWIRWVKLTR